MESIVALLLFGLLFNLIPEALAPVGVIAAEYLPANGNPVGLIVTSNRGIHSSALFGDYQRVPVFLSTLSAIIWGVGADRFVVLLFARLFFR